MFTPLFHYPDNLHFGKLYAFMSFTLFDHRPHSCPHVFDLRWNMVGDVMILPRQKLGKEPFTLLGPPSNHEMRLRQYEIESSKCRPMRL